MIDKKEFQKMAKGILKFEKGIKNPKLMHPEREWTIGMVIGLLILIVTAVWSSTTYVSYRNEGNIDGTTIESETVVYRESLVKSALETYAERQQVYEDLIINNQSDVSQPEPVQEVEPVSTSTESTSEEGGDEEMLPTQGDQVVEIEDEAVIEGGGESEESVLVPQLSL